MAELQTSDKVRLSAWQALIIILLHAKWAEFVLLEKSGHRARSVGGGGPLPGRRAPLTLKHTVIVRHCSKRNSNTKRVACKLTFVSQSERRARRGDNDFLLNRVIEPSEMRDMIADRIPKGWVCMILDLVLLTHTLHYWG